ncbi:MAG: TolC family protein [Spirochaetales bacterium]
MNEYRRHRTTCCSTVPVVLAALLLVAAPAMLTAQRLNGGERDNETSTSTLSIEQAQRLAESENGDIQRARIAVEQARAEIDIARSRRMPQISGELTGSYLFFPEEGESIEQGALGTVPDPSGGFPTPVPDSDIEVIPDAESTFYSLSSSVEQVLFTWGRVSEGISAAEHERAAVAAEATGERVDLAREVREAYFSAVLARDTVQALTEAESIITQIVEDREEAYDTGRRTWEEVLEMRSQAASVRRQRVSAEQGQRSALHGLSILTGIDAGERELVSDYNDSGNDSGNDRGEARPAERPAEASGDGELGETDEEELLDSALGFSPRLRALRERSQAARSALRIAERTDRLRYPDLALVLDFEVSGQLLPFRTNWQDRWDTELTVTLATQFTLFDGGAQAARIRRAEGDLESVRLGMSDATDGVEMEVRSAREAVVSAEAELRDVEAELAYVTEQRRNAEVSNENEIITREEMLLARLREITARIDRSSAAFRLDEARTRLNALTGAILE